MIDGSYVSARLTDGTVRIGVTSFTPQPPSVSAQGGRPPVLVGARELAAETRAWPMG